MKGGWLSPLMSAASRAISLRFPLVDLILDIRDARIPLSSELHLFRNLPSSHNRIVVLNKADLANRPQVKEWMTHFELHHCFSYAVNSHNKENVQEFLNFLKARVRELKRTVHSGYTTTIMLVGIPNVGKSALANSLHQIGRSRAAEKGKLKHAMVSPDPGETKDISSLKIGSHPNIYVLDTPGILPPEIPDIEIRRKLALTGVMRDSLVGEKELAKYFLEVLNLSDEYKKWAKFSTRGNDKSFITNKAELSSGSEAEVKWHNHYPTDHTQDFIVHDVRGTLFDSISCFHGNLDCKNDLVKLVETQFISLKKALRVSEASGDDVDINVSAKLLNLYRTGRLGHFTLDSLPKNIL